MSGTAGQPGATEAASWSRAPPARWPVRVWEEKVIVIGLSGHGLLELGAYDAFLSGRLEDDPLSDDALAAALAGIPEVS